MNKHEFFHWPFYNAAPLLIYLNIDVMENSAHVMHSRTWCATILVIFVP